MSALNVSSKSIQTLHPGISTQERKIPVGDGGVRLASTHWTPDNAGARLILAHDGEALKSGVLEALREALFGAGYEVLEVYLIRPEEARDRLVRYDIPLLARRLRDVAGWAERLGFGRQPLILGTGNAVAAGLWLGSKKPCKVKAVVGICGRPHLAEPTLGQVEIPSLLLADGNDPRAQHMNRIAARRLGSACELRELTEQNQAEQLPRLIQWVESKATPSAGSKVISRYRMSTMPALGLLRSLISLAVFFSWIRLG
jgi:hypothetical protein